MKGWQQHWRYQWYTFRPIIVCWHARPGRRLNREWANPGSCPISAPSNASEKKKSANDRKSDRYIPPPQDDALARHKENYRWKIQLSVKLVGPSWQKTELYNLNWTLWPGSTGTKYKKIQKIHRRLIDPVARKSVTRQQNMDISKSQLLHAHKSGYTVPRILHVTVNWVVTRTMKLGMAYARITIGNYSLSDF
jgi:hypothetical protein